MTRSAWLTGPREPAGLILMGDLQISILPPPQKNLKPPVTLDTHFLQFVHHRRTNHPTRLEEGTNRWFPISKIWATWRESMFLFGTDKGLTERKVNAPVSTWWDKNHPSPLSTQKPSFHPFLSLSGITDFALSSLEAFHMRVCSLWACECQTLWGLHHL